MTRLAFNVFNPDSMEALAAAANETNIPVFMQVSVSTVRYLGIQTVLKIYNEINEKKLIQLHLDHCNDLDFIKRCIDSGWNSIMADFSSEPIDENIKKLNIIRSYLPESHGKIEGEVGSIGGEEDEFRGNNSGKAKLDEIRKILNETQIDLLAVGIGNIHGHYSDNSQVDYDHFKLIFKTFPSAKLVLHGATGLPLRKIKELVPYGLEKVNFSTELKDVYISALNQVLSGADKYNMTKYSSHAKSCMTLYFSKKMKEFT